MKTTFFPILAGFSLMMPAWCDEAADTANLDALKKSAAAYVEAYNKGDAGALARTYLPDGEITLANGAVVSGREEIQAFYEDELAGDGKSSAVIEAESVRFLTPGIAVENGTLFITAANGEVSAHDYTAVQVKQEDGSWLTASVRGESADQMPPSARMTALDWIIGDWVIQMNDSETTLSFTRSKLGPYIEGTAKLAQIDGSTDTVSIRIAWDNERKDFVSWSFDSSGGFVHSDWTAVSDLLWLLRTKGVTAEGLTNQYNQIFEMEPERQSFKWIIRDHTIGDEVQADRVLTAVKRPPAPKGTTPKADTPASK